MSRNTEKHSAPKVMGDRARASRNIQIMDFLLHSDKSRKEIAKMFGLSSLGYLSELAQAYGVVRPVGTPIKRLHRLPRVASSVKSVVHTNTNKKSLRIASSAVSTVSKVKSERKIYNGVTTLKSLSGFENDVSNLIDQAKKSGKKSIRLTQLTRSLQSSGVNTNSFVVGRIARGLGFKTTKRGGIQVVVLSDFTSLVGLTSETSAQTKEIIFTTVDAGTVATPTHTHQEAKSITRSKKGLWSKVKGLIS